MKFYNTLLAFACSIVMLATVACSSDHDGPDTPDEPQTYRRSVLIYMAAQNSLGDKSEGYTSASALDSAEIVSGTAQLASDKDNVFLFLDDAQKPRLYRIYRIGNGSSKRALVSKVYTWATDVNSADPETLREALTYVATNYPSDSYGLVMWSHGDGWILSSNVQNTLSSSASNEFYPSSFGVDVGPGGDMANDTDAHGNIGTQMDIADMAQAIQATGIHLDYIFFDACLMQCIEVAYELRNVADYIIGSSNTTSAYGGYYRNLIPNALFEYPTNDENIQKIADQYYYDAVDNPSLRRYYEDVGEINSVIKTSQLDNLAAVTGLYINNAIQSRLSPDMTGVQRYSTSTYFNSPDFYDMGSALYHLLGEEDYQTWRAEADKCILCHNASSQYILGVVSGYTIPAGLTDPDHVIGVSMYIPQDIFDSAPYDPFNTHFQSTAWYQAANWAATGW